jgi:nitroimidazol reductase NimA-like FMN-containing flavoprotein (pyridoxamine 5'-phosphate oxidase superfamily)
MEELTRAQCLELMTTMPVGRIGVSLRALPVILPVNFVLVGENIVIRTIPGTKLDAATANAVVAFEVDSYAPDGTTGWSVLVQGVSSEITDPRELLALAGIPLRAWALDDRIATRLVRIESSFISGRRFRHRQM